jgi:hypothetical protein
MLFHEQPGNAAAAHALGWAQQPRSEVLWGTGKTQEALPTMRLAAASYGELASPGAQADAMIHAASAYGGPGDELGQSGTASLSDPAAALAAFRKALKLEERIIQIGPTFPERCAELP